MDNKQMVDKLTKLKAELKVKSDKGDKDANVEYAFACGLLSVLELGYDFYDVFPLVNINGVQAIRIL